jgi:hypothetical protein
VDCITVSTKSEHLFFVTLIKGNLSLFIIEGPDEIFTSEGKMVLSMDFFVASMATPSDITLGRIKFVSQFLLEPSKESLWYD